MQIWLTYRRHRARVKVAVDGSHDFARTIAFDGDLVPVELDAAHRETQRAGACS